VTKKVWMVDIDAAEAAGWGPVAITMVIAFGGSFREIKPKPPVGIPPNTTSPVSYWKVVGVGAGAEYDSEGWFTKERAALAFCCAKNIDITPLGNDAHSCAPNTGESRDEKEE